MAKRRVRRGWATAGGGKGAGGEGGVVIALLWGRPKDPKEEQAGRTGGVAVAAVAVWGG